ncbi:S8 family peptidase [Lentzea sp. NEAU-D7]|uniref:S8 family peptidase n=1 Tax=Lentzea sp. NEAU-D7 TaxID=2994667 RepID=UPI00224A9849|nr:S8 family peptidase [Lentzea sp. NEAU-D7]MCX2948677.1 S8 family serine peptidase [Lentzea sp. NEAU-D7]MCX2951235.1 S8 family serine peptidase [Lentzea sp. NEAU-D7]
MRLDRTTRVLAAAGLGLAVAAAVSSPVSAQTGSIQKTDRPVAGSYIVVFKDGASDVPTTNAKALDLARKHGGKVSNTYVASVRGFAVKLDEAAARRLAADPSVAYVQQDGWASISDTQTSPTWGLDRIDQANLPLDQRFTYPNTASNVTAYVLDTGIYKAHTEFEGRAVDGYDFIDNDSDASDCQGHGTHVAGTVGSKTYGVAKKVGLVAVRVLDCSGNGQYSQIIKGIDWVAQNAKKPAVANMSLGGGADSTVDSAVKRAIAAGVTFGLAAGNNNGNACNTSPARVPEGITVAASDSADKRSIYTGGQASNWGSCVDLFGPGSNITSTRNGGGTTSMGGTSMATPHVVGAAALYVSANPSATPAQVRDALVNNATTGKITDLQGSPNKLLNISFMGGGGPDPEPCAAATNGDDVSIPDNNTAVTSSVTVTGCTGKAPATTQVKVDINHPYTADLAIDLVGPSGAVYSLKKAKGATSSGGVHETFTVDASAEDRNGTWKLQVTDVWTYDAGNIDTWTLTF